MPKIFHKRSGSWTEVKSVFHKRNSAWTEVLNVFRRVNGSWIKVFSASKIPGNTVPPTITGNGYLYGTLTNSNVGTWTNTPTSYSRQWRRGTPPSGGGEPTSYSNISGATSSTYVTTDLEDGKYVVCQITATNALGSNVAVSNPIYINKYAPVSLSPYTLSGASTVGSTLTATEQIGSWKSTTTISGDTSPNTFEYEWSYSDGTIIQSSTLSFASYPRNINSSSLLIDNVDLNKIIRVRVTGTNTGGSATSIYTSSGTVTTVYSFSFGNTLYVGSNGYIGLDNGGYSAGTAGVGRNVNIWNEDLVQYRLQEYSDSTNYYLYFRSYRYQSPLVQSAINALDYQIKFYTGQPYCDVYLVRAGSSVPIYIDAPGYYSSGLSQGTGIPGPFFWGAGSVLRIYFNGTLASFSAPTWSAISDGLWKDITTASIDDSFTSVITSANQSSPFPLNTSLPTLTTNTGNFSAGSIITVNAGTWNNVSSYKYELLWDSSTPIADASTNTKTLINTNQYVITDGDAVATSYYFRGRVTGYASVGQTGNSTIALSSTSARSTFNSTSTISTGTATSSGFTISGIAGPLSTFGTTRVNVTSIQIFNSSQSLLSTITTGLPVVNGTTGAWSYVWTGGSASTTYYAKVTVTATDSSQTAFTTGFSNSITTSAGVSTPTSLSSSINSSNQIVLTFSGGSGDQYDVFYANSNTRPADDLAFADFPNVTSPYTATTLTNRDITRWFWVRKSTGTLRSGWFPASPSVVTARIPLFAPPTPTITNSSTSSTSLSWYWDEPTPNASQDSPTSWDYAITQSTATPSSWTNLTTRPTSTSPLATGSLSVTTTYYLHVRAKNADATGSWTYLSATTAATLYTVTFSANGATGSPSVSSVTQSSAGTAVTLATIGTMAGGTNRIFGGWRTGTTSGDVYGFGASYTPSANITLYAYYGTAPTCIAPSINFRRYPNNTSTSWEYFGDYPTPSGAYTAIIGMQYEVYSANSTAGATVAGGAGTLPYPTGFLYPYTSTRDTTIWSFLIRSGEDGRTTAAVGTRFSRFRVRMRGIDGLNYPGTYTSPLF